MSERTPGPWTVSEVRTVEGEYMVVGGPGQEFGLIAAVTELADAQAIAALPEIVKALEDALRMLQAAHMQSGIHHAGNKRVIAAREVLAKVKGARIPVERDQLTSNINHQQEK